MKIVFAKCKTAKIFRLRRATNAKTTINMNKRHIYYLNVVFSARRRRKNLGVFLPYKTPPPLFPHILKQGFFFLKDISWCVQEERRNPASCPINFLCFSKKTYQGEGFCFEYGPLVAVARHCFITIEPFLIWLPHSKSLSFCVSGFFHEIVDRVSKLWKIELMVAKGSSAPETSLPKTVCLCSRVRCFRFFLKFTIPVPVHECFVTTTTQLRLVLKQLSSSNTFFYLHALREIENSPRSGER